MAMAPERHRSAMRRVALSRPMATAIKDGLVATGATVLDYGCGRGGDVAALCASGVAATGWDPVFAPKAERAPASIVNLGYVVNVIEDPKEREATLRSAWALATQLLVVSARLTDEAPEQPGPTMADGVITRIRTFQKFYEQQELRAWIDYTLSVQSIAAAPGIFYVFADERLRALHLATRQTRASVASARVAPPRGQSELGPLIDFLATHGRPPEPAELPKFGDVVGSGGPARAFVDAARFVVDLDAVRRRRTEDLLITLALARFDGRPKATAMPPALLADARAFVGSYAAACSAADDELMGIGAEGALAAACRGAGFGKLMPTALYVHAHNIVDLPSRLRLFEGCARGYVGAVGGANVVKLGIDEPTVSYLEYEDFDVAAHPRLARSTRIHLRELAVRARDYRRWPNRPILHRKELLLPEGAPRRETYARLTAAEERHGLYADPASIGTERGWAAALANAGVRISGHRLLRDRNQPA
ncbi:DNA phosphorothioation-associated putative methyltransferase [Sphingomonas sp.]|jgi:DNA phosphorothioation-associated putative methyltransferase|uniref:DNA phosphorothioation-associated putative methyltransferase n=1 Tax=Sphingomonas sp. TaxID=28214 RepID=UPI002E34546E|nr:DNA phosphorothioation-associated putative methyltransferase [Sphingomonas sp.]HEX4694475.1 DNA phosphorothioation-associated putative methyltransferase [Sphingomonas sp.]